MKTLDTKQRFYIWEGLENIRQVFLDVLTHGTKNINQKTLDKIFSGYNFKLNVSKREALIEQIKKQLQTLDAESDLAIELKDQLGQLENLEEELMIKRETSKFSYEIVLKEKDNIANLTGFVKIVSLDDPRHRALVSWQHESRDPIIFLAELVPENDDDKIFFHINLGEKDGMAIISEEESSYRWTHVLACDFPEFLNAEFGSVSMDKNDGNIKLEDGNIAAATALTKAETTNQDGVRVFDTNIKLMKTYKTDLQKLNFNY